MAKQVKYYVVWNGRKKWVFNNRPQAEKSVRWFPSAQFKSFLTKAEADSAFAGDYEDYKGVDTKWQQLSDAEKSRYGQPDKNSICVDAACSGNPWDLEFRGVDLKTKKELFRYGPFKNWTTNIGEFLALVVGAKLIVENASHHDKTLYSDSKIALWRLQKGKCRTQLQQTPQNDQIFQRIQKAEEWLSRHDISTLSIKKRHTKAWGEIPSDFGRK